MSSSAFYDDYVGRQLNAGVNERHTAILGKLRKCGLRRGDRVLEIGTGVGTLTGLVAAEIGPEGALSGIDLSPASIEAAKKRLAHFKNLTLLAGDALEIVVPGTFDVVVLPDVIEHIPLERH